MNKLFVSLALILPFLAACQSTPTHGGMMMTRHNMATLWEPGEQGNYQAPYSLDLKAMQRLDGIFEQLNRNRVVFVGENHDRMDHHLNQLEIIRRMYQANNKLAIGMEMFQQPYQPALDRYIAGETDERQFLVESEYFERWRIDYRYYRPIIQFARENGIPLIALDVTDELRGRVGALGLEGLSPAEREQVPAEIDRSNTEYRRFMQAIFQMHPPVRGQDFEKFLEVQLVRDEAMAETAANWLKANPDGRMVILAGGGHLNYGYGIPDRLQRRLKVSASIVLNGMHHEPKPELADYVLLPRPLALPPGARLGVFLDTREKGRVLVNGFAKDSPARSAGLHDQDRILMVAGQQTASLADLKFALLDKKPGDKVGVKVSRKSWAGADKELELNVTLY